MATSPTRSRLQPEQRRAQLLICAMSATAEHGVARVTHAHVARRAGVSVAAVHSYFRTREDLVAAILAVVEERLVHTGQAALVGMNTPRTALFSMARALDGVARAEPDLVKVWLDWSTGCRAEVWHGYLLVQETLQAMVRQVLEGGQRLGEVAAGVNIRMAAQLYIGGGHTAALARFAGAGEDELALLITYLVESVLGLGARQPALA